MMNLRPSIFARELPVFSVRSAGSLKRRLAKVVFGAVLVAVSAPLSHAGLITMSATFSDGSVGTGSFMTDPTMCISFKCTEGSGLSGFAFSVLDASFNDADAAIGQFTFFSQLDKISSALMPDGLTGDHIEFTPTGTGTFSALWIDGGLPKTSNNGVNSGVVVPEPSSLILLLTALAVTARWRVRREAQRAYRKQKLRRIRGA
jgi:hypothetical protein